MLFYDLNSFPIWLFVAQTRNLSAQAETVPLRKPLKILVPQNNGRCVIFGVSVV